LQILQPLAGRFADFAETNLIELQEILKGMLLATNFSAVN
jgi:hypothetical protein